MKNKIILGDCLEVLKTLDENSIDAVVTDPPYGIGFMGKEWDSFKATGKSKLMHGTQENGIQGCYGQEKGLKVLPRFNIDTNTFQEFSYQWAKEVLRVLKPGGYLLSFGGTRTYHRMACAIEDAGFEIRDMIMWIYGSGFPKSLNIGKAVDKLQGNERVEEEYEPFGREGRSYQCEHGSKRYSETLKNIDKVKLEKAIITKGTSEWEGWGTALKPALEPICVARKPLSEKTVAENCFKWGTGGINIDGGRIGTEIIPAQKRGKAVNVSFQSGGFTKEHQGRFPANLIHDGSDEVVSLFPNSKSSDAVRHNNQSKYKGIYEKFQDKDTTGFNDSGSNSRFFYCAKASKSERNRGCEELLKKKADLRTDTAAGIWKDHNAPHNNSHPTVKPIALMEYLVKLVSREGAVVLDPFAGSGSTLIACKKLNRNYLGIELNPEYIKIAEKRISQVPESLGL